ncbi:MAG: isomerizing glutamine--fructose-6-phosphate transaminase, partial [Candidatus Aenigmatarchaeota archaeon]
MCGITAYYGNEDAAPFIYDSLKRLDYRGYDSAGIATCSNPELKIKRDVGKIDEIHEKHDLKDMDGTFGIGHTRWATHGGVSKKNAHPHRCCEGRFAIVHNGIIENWKELKEELEDHDFTSETDSEVIAHYIEETAKEADVEEAIRSFLNDAEGSFAVALMDTEERKLFTMKNGSPLALGVGDDGVFVGSDIYAFSPYTDETVFMGDNEYAVIEHGGFEVKDHNGQELEKDVKNVDWSQEESGKGDYDHHMISEIKDIPRSLEKLENSLRTDQRNRLKDFANRLKRSDKVIFTAAGTSYHASLLGVYFLQKAGIEAQTLIASEFKNYERVDEDTLLVAISQSGETKDVLDAIEHSKERGAEISSITNV